MTVTTLANITASVMYVGMVLAVLITPAISRAITRGEDDPETRAFHHLTWFLTVDLAVCLLALGAMWWR